MLEVKEPEVGDPCLDPVLWPQGSGPLLVPSCLRLPQWRGSSSAGPQEAGTSKIGLLIPHAPPTLFLSEFQAAQTVGLCCPFI